MVDGLGAKIRHVKIIFQEVPFFKHYEYYVFCFDYFPWTKGTSSSATTS